MGRLLPFRRRRDESHVPAAGRIGPAPWDVVEYVPREQLRPARLQRGPEPPWPLYRSMHGHGRLARDTALGSLALLTLLGALVAARVRDAVLAGILVGVAALWWGYWSHRLRRREEGLAGERRLERELTRLRAKLPGLDPADAVLLCDVVLEVEGQRAQFDALLLTTACAVVFEVKHWSGRQIALPDGSWRSGGEERPSPAEQALRQARLLAAWLGARGIRGWPVVALVVFTHPRAQLEEVPAGVVTLPGLAGALARELTTRLPAITPQELRAVAAALIAADAGVGERCAG